MPFTYSIANGVAFGLITYCLMKLTTGRRQDVKVLTLAISVVFVVRYAIYDAGINRRLDGKGRKKRTTKSEKVVVKYR